MEEPKHVILANKIQTAQANIDKAMKEGEINNLLMFCDIKKGIEINLMKESGHAFIFDEEQKTYHCETCSVIFSVFLTDIQQSGLMQPCGNLLKVSKYSRVSVPSANNFAYGVDGCKNLENNTSDCDHDKLLSMKDTINDSFEKILKYLDADYRVPPLCISRYARGGKTTILKDLFDELRKRNICSIIVSFNGGQKNLPRTSIFNSFLRGVGMAFMDGQETGVIYDFDASALVNHINTSAAGRPVVLIVDELNMLGIPIDRDIASFIKQNFLDMKNRYFIFSTHIPLLVDSFEHELIIAKVIMGGSSGRGLSVPVLPVSLEFDSLMTLIKEKSKGETFTPLEIALSGAVPSLMYSKLCLKFNFSQYFDGNTKGVAFPKTIEEKDAFYGQFVDSLLNGSRRERLSDLEIFCSLVAPDTVKWPLIYVQLMCKKVLSHGKYLDDLFRELEVMSRRAHHGIDWEVTIQIAVYLRCLDAMFNGSQGPFDILSPQHAGKKIQIQKLFLPSHVETLEQCSLELSSAFGRIKEELLKGDASIAAILLLVIPKHANFSKLDGFVCYFHKAVDKHEVTTAKVKIVGYQCKAGKDVPSDLSLPAWVSKAYLLRGKPPDSTMPRQDKWIYYDSQQVKQFVGRSFEDSIPNDLPVVNTAKKFP